MAFDLATATPVKETEDNEIQTKQFDFNTARPIPEPTREDLKVSLVARFQPMDKQVKNAILQPLEVKDIENIKIKETEGINALWAGIIPYVKGAAGFFTRPFGVEPFGDTFTPEELATARGKHPVATTIGDIIGGISPFIAIAPLFPQSLLGTVATFGSVAGVQEIGRQQTEENIMTPPEERIKDIAKEVGKAGLFAPIWYYTGILKFVGRPYASALTRAGIRGIGSASLSKVYGEDLETALKEGGMITALSLIFEAPYLAKTALGRGIIKQGNRIAAERGLPEGKVTIDVDKLDAVSMRSSIFKLAKGLAKLMKIKTKAEVPTAQQLKYMKVDKPIDINPKMLPAKIDNLTPSAPKVTARPVGTPEIVVKEPPKVPEIKPERPPVAPKVPEKVLEVKKPIEIDIDTMAGALKAHPEYAPTPERVAYLTKPEIRAEYERLIGKLPEVPPVKPILKELATTKQKAQAHIIAKEKAFISKKGKVKPQYRFLAQQMTGKKSIADMTQEEADIFIDALKGLPEPTYKAGKLVPPTMPRTTAIVTEKFFETTFKKPTPVKFLTSQARYAELLGVKKLAEPFEIGKQKLDLEYGKIAKQIDIAMRELKKFKTTTPEKMAQLLNIHEEAPPELSEKDKKVFNYFRDLTRDIINRENSVRMSLGLKPITYRKAYFRHTADKMAQEVIEGKYPLPEGIKYWSEQVVGKKVYNPMEMQRKLRDDLLEHFSKDPAYVMKSMVWTGLKEIYLAQPKHFFNRILGALSKDKAVYKNLTPKEKAHYDAQMTMPAETKKWLIEYVNIALSGRQTTLDKSVNQWIVGGPKVIKATLNAILKPFGKHIGQKPVTDMITKFSKLPIYGVMGGIRPKQLLRNKFQTLQNMALYGVKNTLLGYLPTSSYPTLEKLKTDSLFLKSYSGFEDMPMELKGKAEKLLLAPYQWSAISNVNQAMNAAYHWTADCIQNSAKKDLGWADPQRTYTEDKNFFYPSEKARLLKEMEYGAHTTQFQYIGMGMPEVFRYKALAGITRLQSWWMNHWFIFHREAATRFFTGRAGYDPNLKITWGDRINYAKYLIIAGLILNTLGYERSYVFGTAPTSLPPPAQLSLGLYIYFTHLGDSDWEKRKRGEASRQIKQAALTFIPGYLTIKDLSALLSGEKHWTEYLFYKKAKPAGLEL